MKGEMDMSIREQIRRAYESQFAISVALQNSSFNGKVVALGRKCFVIEYAYPLGEAQRTVLDFDAVIDFAVVPAEPEKSNDIVIAGEDLLGIPESVSIRDRLKHARKYKYPVVISFDTKDMPGCIGCFYIGLIADIVDHKAWIEYDTGEITKRIDEITKIYPKM